MLSALDTGGRQLVGSELLQFYNLLTGVMRDQPVTLSNTLSVGGDQRDAPALKCYGPLEVYASRRDLEPVVALGLDGLRWGSVVLEGTGDGGLRVGPLEVGGDLVVHGRISGELPFDGYITRYLRELRPGTIAIERLLLGGANAEGAGLTHAQAPLQVRSDGMGTIASFQSYAVNWLQFNVRIEDELPGTGWQGKRLSLDFDVDNLTAGTAGRISMRDGKVGIGNIPDIEAKFVELEAHLHRLELQLAVANRRLLGRR